MKPRVGNPQSDHLILWSDRPRLIASGDEGFFERDWSLGWVNFLLQEVGPYALFPFERFKFEHLDLCHFVYLPSSLAEKLKTRHEALFESFVQSGGTLIIEGPVANSLKCSGIRFSSKEKYLKSITSFPAQRVPHPLAESLLQMPFKTLGWETASREKNLEVILEMEGMDVFFKRSLGRGAVFTLGFDFGLLLVGLQQGIPVKGAYRLQKLFGTQTRVIEPEDLVVKASLLDNPIPWADLFERFLFKTITQNEPAPRWWYFPGPYTGAVISTHDDEALGADPRLEAQWQTEKTKGIRGTFFIISDASLHGRWSGNGGLRRLEKEGADVGLHWNRFKTPRLKWRRFRWGMREEPLQNQIRFLEEETGHPIRINRNHYLAMGECYDEHFKSLAQEGILLDSTYGPNQGGRGYLFGTGYPYVGLTWEGTLSGVLELPFLTQETWGRADLPFLERLIRESDENFHQVVMMIFHPHYTVLREEGRATWLGSLSFAKERKQWLPTLGEFFEFFTARSASFLRSRFRQGSVEVLVDSHQEQGVLSFPLRTSGGAQFAQAEVDGRLSTGRQVLNGWFEEVLIPVPKGRHEVKVIYEE